MRSKENVKTPCIRKCQLKDGVCMGCNRTLDEIVKAGNKK